jgi:uncharacterized protein (TIGR03067 family)
MKKRFVSWTCLCLAVLTVTATGQEKDAPKLEGTWNLTGVDAGGKKMPADLLAKFMIMGEFKDGKYTFTVMGKTDEAGTYKIDATKKPATIDLTITEGKSKGKTQLGLFKIEGDTLTLAMTQPGSTTRPKGFEPGQDVEIQTMKRKK